MTEHEFRYEVTAQDRALLERARYIDPKIRQDKVLHWSLFESYFNGVDFNVLCFNHYKTPNYPNFLVSVRGNFGTNKSTRSFAEFYRNMIKTIQQYSTDTRI